MVNRVEEFEQLLGRSRWQRFRAFVRFAFRWAYAGMPDPVDMSLTYHDNTVEYVIVGFVMRKTTRRPIAGLGSEVEVVEHGA